MPVVGLRRKNVMVPPLPSEVTYNEVPSGLGSIASGSLRPGTGVQPNCARSILVKQAVQYRLPLAMARENATSVPLVSECLKFSGPPEICEHCQRHSKRWLP